MVTEADKRWQLILFFVSNLFSFFLSFSKGQFSPCCFRFYLFFQTNIRRSLQETKVNIGLKVWFAFIFILLQAPVFSLLPYSAAFSRFQFSLQVSSAADRRWKLTMLMFWFWANNVLPHFSFLSFFPTLVFSFYFRAQKRRWFSLITNFRGGESWQCRHDGFVISVWFSFYPEYETIT